MTRKEHRKLHAKMHKTLDALMADWIAGDRDRLPSQITLLDFVAWSYRQCENPEGEHDDDYRTEDFPRKPEFIRADQNCICPLCKLPYGAHRMDETMRSAIDNKPFLHVLCDGSRVKL